MTIAMPDEHEQVRSRTAARRRCCTSSGAWTGSSAATSTTSVKARGLSVNQYTTLSVLDRRSGLSNAQLARRALVSPQSMNEVLLTLERRGLVRRRAHPDHGRILQTRLTAKGRRLLAACDAEVREVEARMVGDLSPGEQAALRHGLLSGVRALHGGLDHD